MKVLVFEDGRVVEQDQHNPDLERLQWVVVARDEIDSFDWLQVDLHEQHRADLLNSAHAPFYDSAEDYEMIILRTVDESDEGLDPALRSIAFLLCNNTVFTFHDAGDSTLENLYRRLAANKRRSPSGLLSLLHALFNVAGDKFLRLREPISQRVIDWQDRLLNPNDPFDDWSVIMQAKSSLGRLNVSLQLQKDVLTNWQDSTRYDFDPSSVIKFNDLYEHIARVERFSDSVRTDLDSLTQIYFASTGQRTNTIVQFLAIVSAIFLPLNLVAGFFGMNFEKMPLVGHPLGVVIVIMSMLIVSVLLMWWFKKKNWY